MFLFIISELLVSLTVFHCPAFFVRENLPVLSLRFIVRAIAIIGFTARHLFRANRVCFDRLRFDDDEATIRTPFVNFPKKRLIRITDAPSPPSVSNPFVHTPQVSAVCDVYVVVGKSNSVRAKDLFSPRRCRALASIFA